MIKSVFSAHLSEPDKQDLTLLINDRSLGSLSEKDKSNFVLTASRDVHMICGFSNQSVYYDPRFNKDRIRLWHQIFKEMQSRGLKIFSTFIQNHHIHAEYLHLFNSEIFIGWQDRSQGLYLWRKNNLFRVQPTILPNQSFSGDWMTHTDFYSFQLKQGDMVFSISDKVFARINPQKIEGYFSENNNLATILNGIISQLKIYKEDLDFTWFGFQVERLEKNIFIKEGQSHLRTKADFTSLINSSRVSRVKDGQTLIPAPKNLTQQRQVSENTDEVLEVRDLASQSLKTKHNRNLHVDNRKIRDKKHRLYNLEKLEQRRSEKDVFWDDVKSFSFEPILDSFKVAIKNFFNFIPSQPILSKLIVTAIILLIIVFIFLLGKTLGSKSQSSINETTATSVTFETRMMEINEEVKAPDITLMEVDLTVKANNLQVRQEPKADAAIVATVQRGAKLTQLTESENNWVYVRLSDGKTYGYVYADSLFSTE